MMLAPARKQAWAASACSSAVTGRLGFCSFVVSAPVIAQVMISLSLISSSFISSQDFMHKGVEGARQMLEIRNVNEFSVAEFRHMPEEAIARPGISRLDDMQARQPRHETLPPRP